MKKLFQAAAIAAAISLLSGCAALTEGNTDAMLLTQYSVIKIIDGDPDKAARIEAIAQEIRQYATGDEYLTIDLLVEAIKSRVPWQKLDAADELLVHALIDRLRTELIERFGADVLPEDLQLAADTVAGWVIDAARMI